MWTDANRQIINDNDQYVGQDGTTYPGNFPKKEIPGLIQVAETPRPDGTVNQVRGFIVDETCTQVWSYTPIAADVLAERESASMQEYLGTVRELREKILNRLAGIGLVAMASSDGSTLAAIIDARQKLLDITKDPGAVAAATCAALEAAIKAAYTAIVMAAPTSLRNAFDTVDE